MKIQVVAIEERDMIRGYKDFFVYPPSLEMAQKEIDIYMHELFKDRFVEIINIKKYK